MFKFILLSLISTSVFAGSLYSDDYQWRTKSIRACFAKGESGKRELEGQSATISSWSSGNKKQVQEWVTTEYSLARTGVEFTGWKDCKDDPAADVVVFYGRRSLKKLLLADFIGNIRAESTIGPSAYGDIEGYEKAKAYVWLQTDGLTRGTVTHEFGHALGLHHEHYAWDAAKDPKCKDEPDAGAGPTVARASVHGEYDSDSIMSYCQLHQKGGTKLGLSDGDVKLLLYLFSK